MNSIDISDLARVSGGASQWDSYVSAQRKAIAPAYKQVVCAGAGVKGGPQMATQVYGADRATDGDKIRAAETLKGICLGGSHLPAAAPASPF